MTSEHHRKLLQKLKGLVTNIKWTPEGVALLFKALLRRFPSASKKDSSHPLTWMMKILHTIEINYITPSWKSHKGQSLIDLVQNKTITDEELNKCLSDDREKTLEEIIDEIDQEQLNEVDEKLLRDVKDIVSTVHGNSTIPNDGSRQSELKKMLHTLCLAVDRIKKYKPRLTQMVSWCLMALPETGRLIQVGTGEGKSCIIAMFAAYQALRGKKVDIMCSSSVLAERDLNEWETFYKDLKISVACNANKFDENLKKCYECQVVYGTAEQFAGDWLKQRFQRMDVFGQREFQCAIVDEVDSLMLDKGNHVVYLGSDMPALQHLNPLLAFIWATVNQCSKIYSDKDSVLRAAAEEVKHKLHFTPCELSKAKSRCYIPGFCLNLVQAKLKIWIENAYKAKTMTKDHEYIIEKHGIVPVDYSSTGVIENYMEWTDGLHQFLQMKHESKINGMTAITNYMSNVGLLQKYQKDGNQIYGMSGTLGEKAEINTLEKIYKGIKTCVIPSFKRRKLFEVEGVVVEDESTWTDTISDVVIEQTKPTTYRDPRAVLIICETIKRAKDINRQLQDKVKTSLYINNNMDNSAIFSKKLEAGEVIIATNLAGRGTDLKVSDEINTAGGLFVVQTFLPKNARVEAQAFGRTARQGSPGSGQLIVCLTHLSQPLQLHVLLKTLLSHFEKKIDCVLLELLENLFVIHLEFYQRTPNNEGIEDLASLLTYILTENESEIHKAKEARKNNVARELSSYLKNEIPSMKRKESLFSQYLEVLDCLYKPSNDNPAASDLSALNEYWGSNDKPEASVLSALNEYWGMWLLTSFNDKHSKEKPEDRLKGDLKTAIQKLRQGQSPLSNPYHNILYGNDLRKNGKFAESIRMYDKAIQMDPCFGAIAFYNRAFTSLIYQNTKQSLGCLQSALGDLQNALKSVQFQCDQYGVTKMYFKQQSREFSSVSITRFDEHLENKYKVLLLFKENIIEAITKLQMAFDRGGSVKVDEKLVYFLVPSVDYLHLVGLPIKIVNVLRSNDPLKSLQLTSQPSFDIINELECHSCLGLTHVYELDTIFSLGGFISKIFQKILK
ncbi:uncharacterized protein KZ484_018525 [Pholidichthys leucotaenia]